MSTVFDLTEPDGHTYRINLDDDPITPHLISKPARPQPVVRRLTRMLPARVRRRAAAWCTEMSTLLSPSA